MNRPTRRLSTLLLALTLLLAPTAARAQPAAGAADGWIASVVDLLAGLVDGLWSTGAASETGDGAAPAPLDDADAALAPDDTESDLTLPTGALPSWDPNG